MAGHQMGPPVPPQKLTEGIPDPHSIDQQKKAYAKSLDAQLEQGTRMLEQQNEVQKQALVQAADMKKQQYFMQVDQQLKAQEMSVDQQANYQLMGLQQAAHERRALLEQQANAAILDYEQKRVQDEFARTQYDYQRKAAQKQIEMQAEMQHQREAFAQQSKMMQQNYAQKAAGLEAERHAAQVGHRQDASTGHAFEPAQARYHLHLNRDYQGSILSNKSNEMLPTELMLTTCKKPGQLCPSCGSTDDWATSLDPWASCVTCLDCELCPWKPTVHKVTQPTSDRLCPMLACEARKATRLEPDPWDTSQGLVSSGLSADRFCKVYIQSQAEQTAIENWPGERSMFWSSAVEL
ncbi:unnamed protein product [Polarella glacialis]|uniref:Uncharacterized protein n=1 Tax=Polarella glacialis TaxID=89957 RepID=A0A813FXK6_POLGL|nr:unnamed protein product [Polarella glacialis]